MMTAYSRPEVKCQQETAQHIGYFAYSLESGEMVGLNT